MNQTKIPAVGDIVLYFPNGSDEKFSGYFIDRPFPAVVVDGGDLAPYWEWPEIK